MNKRIMRITPELYNLFNERKKKFGTSMIREQTNMVTIMKDIETTIGIDLKSIPVIDGKPRIIPKKTLVRL